MFFWDNNKDTGILIQARSNSTRLPGKIFLPLTIQNTTKSVLEWIYFRLKMSKIDLIYFIIPEDDEGLITFCKNKDLPFLKGPLEDVRERYIQTAKKLKLKYIIRVTSDNPFVEPLLVIPTLKNLIEKKLDLFSYIGFPLGVSIEAFTLDALQKFKQEFNETIHKEHVSLHIKKNPDKFKIEHSYYEDFVKYYQNKISRILDQNLANFYRQNLPRLTLDESLDYETIDLIYKELNLNFTIFDVMDLYFSKPDLFLKNLHVQQKKF
ncbi:MAG: cytidylyltransferase domain-containing protein [Leptonema sp. (in: bacteria)]